MFSKFISILTISTALLLGGCATPTKMAFSDGAATVNPDKAVYLMSVTLKNTFKPSYQPGLLVTHVEKLPTTNSSDRINFTTDDKAKLESSTENGNSYLLRMELENGQYVLRGLTSLSGVFPIRGSFFTPIHADLTTSKPGIYYLGHVTGTVRERQGEEFKAGIVIPLIDQAVVGASTGSFDVDISDQWATDESKFKDKFPVLKSAVIQKAILPPFDRAKAQQWWEKN